jgi:hypothetical protein
VGVVHHFQDRLDSLAGAQRLVGSSSTNKLAVHVEVAVLEEVEKMHMAIRNRYVRVAFLRVQASRHAPGKNKREHDAGKTSSEQHHRFPFGNIIG